MKLLNIFLTLIFIAIVVGIFDQRSKGNIDEPPLVLAVLALTGALPALSVAFIAGIAIRATPNRGGKDPTSDSPADEPAPGGWIAPGEPFHLAGHRIDGMVYAGRSAGTGSKSWINSALKILGESPDTTDSEAAEVLSYHSMSAAGRNAYLRWLASERDSAAHGEKYAPLYFDGLEWRFFRDQAPYAEKEQILDEVIRLRRVFEGVSGFRRDLDRFIDAARVTLCRRDLADPSLARGEAGFPLALRVPIGAMVLRNQPLSGDWLFNWWRCDRESGGHRLMINCAEEFRLLFSLRVADRFPEGARWPSPREQLRPVYRAASGVFKNTLDLGAYGGPLPDIEALRAPLVIASEIANDALRDLEELNRFLDADATGRESLEAYALLPGELRPRSPSREGRAFMDWAREVMTAREGTTTLRELAPRFRGGRPDQITIGRLVAITEILARLGIGLVPDPRVADRAPEIDADVLLFAIPGGAAASEPVGEHYRAALRRVTLVAAIAHVAEDPDAVRRAREISADITGLSPEDRARVDAALEWALMMLPDLARVRASLREGDAAEEAALRELIRVISGPGGDPDRIERALGIVPEFVPDVVVGPIGEEPPAILPNTVQQGVDHSGDTASGAVPQLDPVMPTDAPTLGADTGEVAQEPTRKGLGTGAGLPFDKDELARKLAETEKVKELLGAAMGDGVAKPSTEPRVSLGPAPSRFPGLDATAARLASELLGRAHWSELEFEALAQRHGAMRNGIIEILNEWSIERFDELFVEHYEGYTLSPTIVARLAIEA